MRLCSDHYREKQDERDGQLQREQQAWDAAVEEHMANEQQERLRAAEDRDAKLAEARSQIPGLLAQLRASRVPREKFEVFVRGKHRRKEGWLLFEGSREGFMGSYAVPCHVTTEGEFIEERSFGIGPHKNAEAMAKVIDGDGPQWRSSSFDWIMVANRLRELLSNGG